MSDLSNSSFIPKQGPIKKRRRTASRQVYILTLVSYAIMFAVLIGSAGVYFYSGFVDRQLTSEVEALNNQIDTFSVDDMRTVQNFDLRLQQAVSRVDSYASVLSVLESIEDTVVDTVLLNSVSIERNEDVSYQLTVNMNTDTFDSTIAQRNVYADDDSLSAMLITGLTSSGLDELLDDSDPKVTFTAEIDIPLESVPYVPDVEATSISGLETAVENLVSDSNAIPTAEVEEDDLETFNQTEL